jgi:hypothetical protein
MMEKEDRCIDLLSGVQKLDVLTWALHRKPLRHNVCSGGTYPSRKRNTTKPEILVHYSQP